MSRLVGGKVTGQGNILADSCWLSWIRVVKEEPAV